VGVKDSLPLNLFGQFITVLDRNIVAVAVADGAWTGVGENERLAASATGWPPARCSW